MSPLKTSTSINCNKRKSRARGSVWHSRSLLNAHAYRTHSDRSPAPHHCIPRRHMHVRKFAMGKCVVRTVGERTLWITFARPYTARNKKRKEKKRWKWKKTTKNHQHARYKRWYYVQRTASGENTRATHPRAISWARLHNHIVIVMCVCGFFFVCRSTDLCETTMATVRANYKTQQKKNTQGKTKNGENRRERWRRISAIRMSLPRASYTFVQITKTHIFRKSSLILTRCALGGCENPHIQDRALQCSSARMQMIWLAIIFAPHSPRCARVQLLFSIINDIWRIVSDLNMILYTAAQGRTKNDWKHNRECTYADIRAHKMSA